MLPSARVHACVRPCVAPGAQNPAAGDVDLHVPALDPAPVLTPLHLRSPPGVYSPTDPDAPPPDEVARDWLPRVYAAAPMVVQRCACHVLSRCIPPSLPDARHGHVATLHKPAALRHEDC